MLQTLGIHHVTAITADPQINLNFYEGFLGQRFVKRTVNFDDPNAYHLYYGDCVGSPGTAMTFFSWPGLPHGVSGTGEANAIYYRIPPDSCSYWLKRAEKYGIEAHELLYFGEVALVLQDPDGHVLYLIESTNTAMPNLSVWESSPVPVEYQLLGFYGTRLAVQHLASIEPLLTLVFGYEEMRRDDTITRYSVPGTLGSHIDVQVMPELAFARQGVGSIHHIAVRARDDNEREEFRAKMLEIGLSPTGLVDRTFFHSTYAWTPARILFEIATDKPGFTVNESADSLGEKLVLPTEYEPLRAQIEAQLPPLSLPRHA